ncbi:MAG: Magnetosome protein MamR [Rhodospirillaceae bacterium]|nr:MAG: Magnetosome protein MamR [Rhodospirillaceae bacterium]
MIWTALVRGGTVLSFIAGALQFYDILTREIKPNRVYFSWEAARYLGIERHEVIGLIKRGALRAKMVEGNYRILGKNILEYLNR